MSAIASALVRAPDPRNVRDMLLEAGYSAEEADRMLRGGEAGALVIRRTSPKDVATATHPEDFANEVDSIERSHEVIDAWIEAHGDALIQLILTYSDGSAQAAFEQMREEFWVSVPYSRAETPPRTSPPTE